MTDSHAEPPESVSSAELRHVYLVAFTPLSASVALALSVSDGSACSSDRGIG